MRFGLVGTGFWARDVHARVIAQSPGADLVGVWGRRPDAARVIADEHQARAYDDFAALLSDVDAVAFAVPPNVQAPLAIRAALAGKHLLLEKPIAFTREDADALVAAVESTGVASVVFFTWRFDPAVRAWLTELGSPEDWDGATGHWMGNAFAADSPFATPWRRDKGGLWDVGPHALSMLAATLGPIDRVHAEGGLRDTTNLLAHHTSGATSMVTLSIKAPDAAALTDLVVWGARGRSSMPDWDWPSPALEVAVSELIATAASAARDHPCDVRFGRDVLRLVIDAAEQLASAPGA
jgi:predicted dehydrogenase